MHIAFVTITLPPDNGWGGIGSYVFHLSHGLIALGHLVTVICGIGKEIEESHNKGLHIIRCLPTGGVNNYQIQHFGLLNKFCK